MLQFIIEINWYGKGYNLLNENVDVSNPYMFWNLCLLPNCLSQHVERILKRRGNQKVILLSYPSAAPHNTILDRVTKTVNTFVAWVLVFVASLNQ